MTRCLLALLALLLFVAHGGSARAEFAAGAPLSSVDGAHSTTTSVDVPLPQRRGSMAGRSGGYDDRSHLARVDACTSAGSSAAKGASEAERGGLNLFKWKDPASTTASGWREGDRMLTVPWKGTPKATWKENASRLRREMRSGNRSMRPTRTRPET